MAENTLRLKDIAWKIVLPVAIGLGVAAYLFHSEFSQKDLTHITFDSRAIIGIAIACLFVCGRDFGLTWRFHTIARPDLTWRRALRVDMMCAFTSAITPSAVGGSALAIFYLNREGVDVGRATALTLTTLFLDELFFVVFCPIVLLVIPFHELFTENAFMQGAAIVFWLVYAGIVVYTVILFVGIIIKPRAVQKALCRIFSWKWLRRWLPAIEETTANMVSTSAWIRDRSFKWWLNVFGATTLSWFSRYFIVNALFWGFVPEVSMAQVFCRQFVIWVLLMVSPTPGGSGVSEWIFTEYYGDLLGAGSLALVLALIWRLITYYIYLVAGACLLPAYLNRKKKKKNQEPINTITIND